MDNEDSLEPNCSLLSIKPQDFCDVSAGKVRDSIISYNRGQPKENPLLVSKGHIIPETIERLLSFDEKPNFREMDNLSRESPQIENNKGLIRTKQTKIDSAASQEAPAFTKTATKTYSRILSFMDDDPSMHHHHHESSLLKPSLSIKK